MSVLPLAYHRRDQRVLRNRIDSDECDVRELRHVAMQYEFQAEKWLCWLAPGVGVMLMTG